MKFMKTISPEYINTHEVYENYTIISTTGDRTSDHRLQYRNSTTEPLVRSPVVEITVYTADET